MSQVYCYSTIHMNKMDVLGVALIIITLNFICT